MALDIPPEVLALLETIFLPPSHRKCRCLADYSLCVVVSRDRIAQGMVWGFDSFWLLILTP